MQTSNHSFRLRTLAGLLMGTLALAAGCFSPWVSSDDPTVKREQIKDVLQSDKRPRIVGDIAYERMITLARLENIALVTQLPSTGGKVKPSQPREKMLDIMRRYEVNQPNSFLDDPSTAMVVAHVIAPPAARKGETLDVQVQLSAHGEATNLRQGWLMKTSLVEMSKLGGTVREGFEFATGQGQVVTAAEINGSDNPLDQTRGVVVGGAKLRQSRELGIGIETEFADAITMAAILPAINGRFTFFNGRKQAGIAVPMDDGHLKLEVPPRYYLDSFHFINVVLKIAFNETESQRLERVEQLRKNLFEPTTVKDACWQLEAMGESGIPALADALNSPSSEIRFYVAHSLAYLNDKRAVAPLAALCLSQPAFRAMSLNGLAIIEHYEAADALAELLHAADPETRYGAVRALRHRDARDPQVSGQAVGETGTILQIASAGPPLIAVSLSQVPEIVIFGDNPPLQLPSFEYVTPKMMINTQPDGKVTVSHFEAGKDDRQVHTTADLRSLLTAISEVGGTYGNWVSFIREASQKGYLAEPIALNPIPEAGRRYEREQETMLEPGEKAFSETAAPMPTDSRVWYNPTTWWN